MFKGSSMFKVGDKVQLDPNVAINLAHPCKTLSFGTIYEVLDVNVAYEPNIAIVNDHGLRESRNEGRFVLSQSKTEVTPTQGGPFKVGDLVVCTPEIIWLAQEMGITDGRAYRVESVSECFIEFKNDLGKMYIWHREHFRLQEPTVNTTVKEPQKCSCEMRDLLMVGCKCGGV